MRAASMTVARSSAVGASSSARAAAPARRGAAVVAAPIRTAGVARNINNSNSNKRSSIPPARALELDWSDPDTLIGALGGVLGLLVGIGAPLFYISRDKKDEGEEFLIDGERRRERESERRSRAWRA